jgi:hypothetical protein
MNRREALYVMGGMIGVSIFSANKYFDYRDKINKRALNKGILKEIKSKKYRPIVEYLKTHEIKLHSEFLLKARSRETRAFNYNIVLKELKNLDFVMVDGFFLSYSEIEESYRSDLRRGGVFL